MRRAPSALRVIVWLVVVALVASFAVLTVRAQTKPARLDWDKLDAGTRSAIATDYAARILDGRMTVEQVRQVRPEALPLIVEQGYLEAGDLTDDLTKWSVKRLCDKRADSAAWAELESRKVFDAKTLELIKTRKISIGMPELALTCSWGRPEDVHTSVGSWGTHKQYVYANAYVYVENGKVASWQN